MTISFEESVVRFSALSREKQVMFLARFSHQLTVEARDTYVIQSDEIADPGRLRSFNEIQHRVSGHLIAVLNDRADRYPDDVLISVLLCVDCSEALKLQTSRAFEWADARTL